MRRDKGGRYSGIGGQAVLEGVAFALRDSFEVAKLYVSPMETSTWRWMCIRASWMAVR